MSWQSVLSEDLNALGLSRTWKWRYAVTHRVALFMRVMRICEQYRGKSGFRRIVYWAKRYQFERISEALGFDIPLGTFGPGLSIAHRGTIVVNGDARIGRNCRIHPGVTIGAVRGQTPTLGDNVFVGPGVGIYGAVHIGDGAVLGPNSLVNFDVPAGRTTVAPRASIREPAPANPSGTIRFVGDKSGRRSHDG